jgi:5-methylcytosine-specific restriction protein B
MVLFCFVVQQAPREAVVMAMARFDRELRDTPSWKNWEEKESFKYAIEHEGRHYPVKSIISSATNTPVSNFSGGDEANTFIEKLGFQVVAVGWESSPASLRQLLEEILSSYLDARSGGDFGKDHPIWQLFRRVKNAILDLAPLRNRPMLRVEWSAGKGEFARVPWIAIIDSREVEAPGGGTYCVFLFREDLSGVYVTLNQGVTKLKREVGPPEARRILADRSQQIRAIVSDIRERGFLLDNDIDLRSAGLGAEYEISTIAYKLYETNRLPPDAELEEDLATLLTAYAKALQPLAGSKSVWLFQANPKLYNIEAALNRQEDEILWSVRTYRDQIHPGDSVFIWRSGNDAGILARATVLTEPAMMDQDSLQFAIQPEKFTSPEVRVRLKIEQVYVPYLSRDELRDDERLADLSILKSAQGTNFPVTQEQAAVIQELLEANQNDEIPDVGGSVQPANESRVWAYSPGPKAQFWEEFYRDEMMAIEWDKIGDLRHYPDYESLTKKLIETYEMKTFPMNDARACFNFVHVMRPGDRVIAKRGRDEVVGYGIVIGDYEYRFERKNYRSVRRVRWERRGNWKCKPLFAVKTLTDFTHYSDEVRYLTDLMGVSEAPAPVAAAQTLLPYTIEDALQGVAFDKAEFEGILDIWRIKKNVILQGPPGVGKTFLARRLAYALIGHEQPSRVEMIQFHQSYSYEDFIQGYRPSGSGFDRKDGVFVRFCKRASLDQETTYVFIIDEINRSNLSKVFGELLMLIEADKRGSKYSLALTYSTSDEEQFYVPSNVYVLGMMNTADRSLAMVDYALRRRFAFQELKPLFGSIALGDLLIQNGVESKLVAAVSQRLQALNQAIADDQNLGPGFMIGHSYFCVNGSTLVEQDYVNAIQHEILPLLKEYWFDDPKRVEQWAEKLGAKFDLP